MRVQVLGSFAVEVESAVVALTPAQKSVVAYLVVRRGHAASAEQIAESVLSSDGHEPSVSAVRVHISKIRKAIRMAGSDDVIRTTQAGYAIDLEHTTVDAVEFTEKVQAGQALAGTDPREAQALLSDALSLWRGEPYADFRYADFVLADVDHLSELHAAALEAMLDTRIRLGQARSVVPELEAMLTAHPYRESVASLLMKALVEAGRQADAISVYDRFAARLREDLALDPPASLRDLCERILNQDLPVVVTDIEPRPIPVPLGTFCGRDDDLRRLEQVTGSSRLVTIVGPGGVGKTRLVLEHASGAPREGLVAFVDLAAVEGRSSVADEVARSLAIRPGPGQGVGAVLAAHLGDHGLLLLVDNCEHLLDETAAVTAELLRLVPNLRVLATSRERLDVAGEVVVHLAPLGGSDDAAWDDAVDLFHDRVVAAGGTAPRSEADRATAREICRRVEGLPLAIEIVASHSRSFSLVQLLRQLDDPLGPATKRRRGASDVRQQSLRATLSWSVELLGAAERDLLGDLSVFRGPFDRDAAAAICDVRPPGDLGRVLERLVDASLVGVDEEDGSYRVMEVVRQYADEEMLATDRRRPLFDRHAAFYLAMVEEFAASIGGPEQDVRLARMDRQRGNWLAALARLLDLDSLDAPRLAGAAWRYWYLRGEFTFGLAALGQAAGLMGGLEDEIRSNVLHGCALLGSAVGRSDEAQRWAHQALELARRTENAERVRAVLTALGGIRMGLGEVREAVAAWTEARDLSERAGDLYRSVVASSKLAVGHLQLGDLERADRYASAARVGAERLGDAYAVGEALIASCDLAIERGELAEAKAFLTATREAASSQGLDSEEAWADVFEGRVCLTEGDAAGALVRVESALARFLDLDIVEGIAQANIERARVYMALGDLAPGTAAVDVADRYVHRGAAYLGPSVQLLRAAIAADAGRLRDARRLVDGAVAALDGQRAVLRPSDQQLVERIEAAVGSSAGDEG